MSTDLVQEVPTEQIGWQVLDPDGNVVDSGPLIVLEMVAEMGQEQGETDGRD